VKKYKLKSFAKINLFLRVLRRLNSGYHILYSLITFCDIHDKILVQDNSGKKDKINFHGKFKAGIAKRNNTIIKTLKYLRSKGFLKDKYFKINVFKFIPHGSGLGGGSANAASLINFFSNKFKFNFKKNEIHEISKKIGSDVPIALQLKNSLLDEKNGKIIRLNKKFNLNILIIFPNLISSTKKIFSMQKKFSKITKSKILKIKTKKNLIKFLKTEKNDLQETVFKNYPKTQILCKLTSLQNGCHFSRITGSGSACIGVFASMNNAIKAKKNIHKLYPKYWYALSKTI